MSTERNGKSTHMGGGIEQVVPGNFPEKDVWKKRFGVGVKKRDDGCLGGGGKTTGPVKKKQKKKETEERIGSEPKMGQQWTQSHP